MSNTKNNPSQKGSTKETNCLCLMTTDIQAVEHLTPLRIYSGCRASGHAWAANFLNLYVTTWEHLTNIHLTHHHPCGAKGGNRGLQESHEEDSSSLGWFASSHRRKQYYMALPVVTQCKESCMAPAGTLQSSCLRDTLDCWPYSSL